MAMHSRLQFVPDPAAPSITGAELVAEPGGADPAGDRPAAAGEDSAEEQQGEPGCGPAVECSREAGEPLAGCGERMRGCHGWLRPGRSAGVETAIVPDGPALVYAARLSGSSGGNCGKCRTHAGHRFPPGSPRTLHS